MSASLPAKLCLGLGGLSLALVVLNQWSAGPADPALERAGVLASLLAVGLMLIGVLWTRAVPEAAARAPLQGEQGLELADDLPPELAEELGWGSQMLLTASAAAVVLVIWQGRWLLRRGLLASSSFEPGEICQRALLRQSAISLVDLRLYPGRGEFASLLPDLPAVVVQPIGSQGLVLLGGWSARCFSRSDLTWLEGWALRLRGKLESVAGPGPIPGAVPAAGSSGSPPAPPDC